jgi:hypothetical protein
MYIIQEPKSLQILKLTDAKQVDETSKDWVHLPKIRSDMPFSLD